MFGVIHIPLFGVIAVEPCEEGFSTMRTRLEAGPCRRELVTWLNGQEAGQTALEVAENLSLAQGSFYNKDFIKKAAEEKWPL